MLTILGSIPNIIGGEGIWPICENKKKIHFYNEKYIHMSSENHIVIGYGDDLNLLIVVFLFLRFPWLVVLLNFV